jgi:hypothetical protein
MTLPTDIWVGGYNFTGAPNLNKMEDNLTYVWNANYNNSFAGALGAIHTGNNGVTNSSSFYKLYTVTYRVTSVSGVFAETGEGEVNIDPAGTNTWTKISGRKHNGQLVSAPSSYNNVSFILPPNGKFQVLSLGAANRVTVPMVYECQLNASHSKYTYVDKEHVTSLTPMKTYFDDVNAAINTTVQGTPAPLLGSAHNPGTMTFVTPFRSTASTSSDTITIQDSGGSAVTCGHVTRNGGVYIVNSSGTITLTNAVWSSDSRLIPTGKLASIGTVTTGQTGLEQQFINAQTTVKKACNRTETTTIAFDRSTSQTFTPSATYPSILTTLVTVTPTLLAAGSATVTVDGAVRGSVNQAALTEAIGGGGNATSSGSITTYVPAGSQVTVGLTNGTFIEHFYWILDMGATA